VYAVTVLAVLLGVAAGVALASYSSVVMAERAAQAGEAPAGSMSVQGDVTAAFYYQGFLTEDGLPVTGRREMEFQLWTSGKQAEQVGVTLTRMVQVQDGQFSTSLGWGPKEFNGRGLVLQVRAKDSSGAWHSLGRKSILPVPYAMSLLPGAKVVRESGGAVLSLQNKGGDGLVANSTADGVTGWTSSTDDTMAGVKGQAMNTRGEAKGGYFSSFSGVGVYGASLGSHGVEGKGGSLNGSYGGYFTGHGGVYGRSTGRTPPGYAGRFEGDVSITDGLEVHGPVVMTGEIWSLTVNDRARFRSAYVTGTLTTGALVVNGPALGSFLRPQWDSHWTAVGKGASKSFTHDVGGDPSNYFVDFQCRDTGSGGMGINSYGYGGISVTVPPRPAFARGAYYKNLTDTTVRVYRLQHDDHCNQVRVRIWLIR
jgi:hypothetical protein